MKLKIYAIGYAKEFSWVKLLLPHSAIIHFMDIQKAQKESLLDIKSFLLCRFPPNIQEIIEDSLKYSESSKVLGFLDKLSMKLLYAHLFRLYSQEPENTVVIIWNGLKTVSYIAKQAALNAKVKHILYTELAPFKNRFTIDPQGVNYNNSLPRSADYYIEWFKEKQSKAAVIQQVKSQIQQRKPSGQYKATITSNEYSVDSPFIFVPLQVPKDTQLDVFGNTVKSNKDTVKLIQNAIEHLPSSWHVRIKQHPSSIDNKEIDETSLDPRIVMDNQTDTFEQLNKSKAVLTVNSSVGLEAFFFNKPVAVIGQAFWSFDELTYSAETQDKMNAFFQKVDTLNFDKIGREAFLTYLLTEYYPYIEEQKEQPICSNASHIYDRLKTFGIEL